MHNNILSSDFSPNLDTTVHTSELLVNQEHDKRKDEFHQRRCCIHLIEQLPMDQLKKIFDMKKGKDGPFAKFTSHLTVLNENNISLKNNGNITDDELLSKFENGKKRYQEDPFFRKSIDIIINGGDILSLIDDILKIRLELHQMLMFIKN